jgi:hypothetical protein
LRAERAIQFGEPLDYFVAFAVAMTGFRSFYARLRLARVPVSRSVGDNGFNRYIFSMNRHRESPSTRRRREAAWIAMRPVVSSSIAAAGYDAERETLRLRYIGGATYDYAGVPAQVFEAFRNAPSRGQFVNWRIKPYYACVRVR